ncbi:3233_t:CDS:2 [Funneliformis caledonium]|uniref:Multiple inositol polyphosphate phosphatase 1 n=1 Tax=Funneliformis caledonium TaxID=1117310 RepID=A0A9N8ZV74_9GLOM|nr:3233_t:CDS:2 [Funneliformis caledonium]
MQFPYRILYSVFIINLFVSNNPTLCKTYEYSREFLLDNHFFYLEPPQTAFALDIEPISYPDKCDLKQLYMISRHGSRYPGPNNIRAFDELEKIFANVDVAKEWYKNPFPMNKNLQLIKRGEIEPYFDGLQSRKRYEKFWDEVEYDPEVIKFQSTQFTRNGASIMSFSQGLFNGKGPLDTCKSQPIYYLTVPPEKDDTCMIYASCKLWNETVASNNKLLDEQVFAYGNKTLTKIANRLSETYHISPPLEPRLVPQLFDNCQFWLTVFNRTDACYLTQLVNGVENYLNGNSSMIADIKNAQSFSMDLILTTLGVFKNEFPLTADLTYEQIKNVKYTEYKLLYWSSTLYFEIYTCSDDSVLIRVLLNFKPFVIPGCNSEYCEWNKFKEILGDKIGCDFNKMCNNP